VNGQNIFNNHILRMKANYQFTKELSLRFITQYDTVLANPKNTSLENDKALNFDVLVTYLLHPGTAIYVGYNSNLSNIDRALALNPVNGNFLRTRDPFTNDGKQFFVKASYLFRF
jgi:predicted porin